jgi:cellobiose epimerase
VKAPYKSFAIFSLALLVTCSFKYFDEKTDTKSGQFTKNSDSIKAELNTVLKNEFSLWYPVSVDAEFGGFFSDLDSKWELKGEQNKFIVTQARHIWSNANAVSFYGDIEVYLKTAKHGFDFLRNVMWDKKFGGFYDLVNRKGEVIKENGEIIKRAYGNSFAIYGLAAYYKVSHDTSALNLAVATFNWLDKNSFDPVNGGYFQLMSREGNPFVEGFRNIAPKDQNSSIHLLECFTELYKVWPDELLKQRLNSLMKIIRDTIVTEKGYMNLFFSSDWKPVSFKDSSENVRNRNIEFDHVSFGHDIEIAYLLIEASEALGRENDSTIHRIAKKLVDHTMNNGWDEKNGGIFDAGYYFNNESEIKIVRKTKEWWSQAEAMNSLLIMSKLYPDDQRNYYKKFCEQWQYIKNFVLDQENGGWYIDGLDTAPYVKEFAKTSIWKCNYHTSRALVNCIRNLN